MDKKEAFQQIIYKLKEIEGTRLRLSLAKPEALGIEIALLNQQVINLYQHLQNYSSGLYASQPAIELAPAPSPVIPEPIKIVETPKPEPKPEPIPAPKPTPAPAKAPEAELKREPGDAQQRKERLKRLEAEASKMEEARKHPEPAPAGKIETFEEYVQEKDDEAFIASEAAIQSGIPHEQVNHAPKSKPEKEVTLNEKLQSTKHLPESLNEKFQQGDAPKTLAEKMKLGPISDLKSAMALNQKIAFTNGLFNGDDKEFKKALSFLNNCTNFSEAKIYLQSEIGKIYNWDSNNPLVEEFTELVYRKFLK